ncbi:hypothetical protein SA58113_0389 [Staphylococcus argenteus]|nr:hypothetical protein SA58113_0389 [Staphylococcus argenteus]
MTSITLSLSFLAILKKLERYIRNEIPDISHHIILF